MKLAPVVTGLSAMPQGQLNVEDVLLSQGVLNAQQVSAIKLENINTGQPIERLILEHNFASVEQIAKARAQLLGVPFVKLGGLDGQAISTEVLNLIPEQVARRYKLIPFRRDGDVISVAMADPLDLQVSQFLEKKTGMRIRRFLALADNIDKEISDQYAQNLTTDVTYTL